MTTLPVVDGARMLGIHPKTLHHWLKQAHLPLAAHPTDARITCVTEEQIQRLAKLHDRPLHPRATVPPQRLVHLPENETEPLLSTQSLPPLSLREAELLQRLSGLETRVATLQEHLAQLALALLAEREPSFERRLTALETLRTEPREGSVPISPPQVAVTSTEPEHMGVPPSPRPLNPAEQRARSRMPPLIEYSAQGTYVVMSSQEGELSLAPDSTSWFDWLATLSSFRFVGKCGRFTAYRDSNQRGPKRGWSAVRTLHATRAKCYVGITDHLTIDALEHAAAMIQARLSTP